MQCGESRRIANFCSGFFIKPTEKTWQKNTIFEPVLSAFQRWCYLGGFSSHCLFNFDIRRNLATLVRCSYTVASPRKAFHHRFSMPISWSKKELIAFSFITAPVFEHDSSYQSVNSVLVAFLLVNEWNLGEAIYKRENWLMDNFMSQELHVEVRL